MFDGKRNKHRKRTKKPQTEEDGPQSEKLTNRLITLSIALFGC